MKRSTRIALIVLTGVLLVAGVAAAAVAHSAISQGNIVVRIEGEEGRIAIDLPAVVVTTALHLAPGALWDEIDDEFPREARPYLAIAKTAIEELGRLPDSRLVSVRDDDETVLIEKRGGAILVVVRSEDESVYVSVPVGTVQTILASLDRKVLAI